VFAYELPRAQAASLAIYDLGGRRVAALASGEQGAGRHAVTWNATDDRGARVAGGLYFARFTTAGLARVERVVVLP
jgi:flagellar hook assembly protein FlgD